MAIEQAIKLLEKKDKEKMKIKTKELKERRENFVKKIDRMCNTIESSEFTEWAADIVDDYDRLLKVVKRTIYIQVVKKQDEENKNGRRNN